MDSHKTYTVKEATLKLMNYCAYQERCHQDVEQKLIELRMIPEARQQIIHTLLEENFLNEERFAQSFARGKFRIKKWGRIRIQRELKRRKVSRFNIITALKEIDDTEYIETLDQLFKKRLESLTEKNPQKLKKKIADYLLYRGWESYLIYEKLNEI
ncbi:regulatory protein RecX [Mesonia sp. MT50]|uniref:Regulatory protein RecX n=1 Tax=Mesonia profundi TaxID=3070998 RepID=A0ABU1A4H3_9FLAO|nr:regulatory protein RecX [Mesonia profundi]MDQ7918600.1 regulatory protein RecX [Mesonia profundi]